LQVLELLLREEGFDDFRTLQILTGGNHPQLATIFARQIVEHRHLGDAWRTPCRPQVYENWLARQRPGVQLFALWIDQVDRRHQLPCMITVDLAGERRGLTLCGLFLRLSRFLLTARAKQRSGKKQSERQFRQRK